MHFGSNGYLVGNCQITFPDFPQEIRTLIYTTNAILLETWVCVMSSKLSGPDEPKKRCNYLSYR